MTPELTATIIAFLLALTALVKQIMDMLKIKAQRAQTADMRNKDSQELHDTVLRHDIMITQIRDTQALHATVVGELKDTVALLNTNIVALSTNVANLTDIVKELKRAQQRA